MLKVVNVTNARGGQYIFGRSIRFLEGPDFSGLKINEPRDFYFKIQIRRGKIDDATMQAQRNRLYTIFNPHLNPMRLELLADDGRIYHIEADLMTTPVMPPNKANDNAAGVKVLLQFQSGAGSLLYEKDAHRTEIATWEGMLEFDVTSLEEEPNFEFDTRLQSLYKNIFNAGQEYAGIKVEFHAIQAVVNPAIININTYENIKLNTTMEPGETIEIVNTHKRITITRIKNNVRTKGFSALNLESTLLLLAPGDNLLRYDADAGIDNLEVAITHHNHWIGV